MFKKLYLVGFLIFLCVFVFPITIGDHTIAHTNAIETITQVWDFENGFTAYNGFDGGLLVNQCVPGEGCLWVKHLFVYDINYVTQQDVNFIGNIIPPVTNTYTLGNSDYYWKGIYTNDLFIYNEISDGVNAFSVSDLQTTINQPDTNAQVCGTGQFLGGNDDGCVDTNSLVGNLTEVYYPTDQNSDIATYEVLQSFPDSNSSSDSVSVDSGTGRVLVDQYMTAPNNPYVTVIPAGTYEFHNYLSISSDAGETYFDINVYRYTIGGEVIPFFGATTEEVNSATSSLYVVNYVLTEDQDINITDRFIVRWYVRNNHATEKTATLYYGGANAYTHIHTSVPRGGDSGFVHYVGSTKNLEMKDYNITANNLVGEIIKTKNSEVKDLTFNSSPTTTLQNDAKSWIWKIRGDSFDQLQLNSNESQQLTFFDNAAMQYQYSGIFNESGGNFDFRVEGENNTNMIFVDANEDKVGIGLNNPTSMLHSAEDIFAETYYLRSTENGITASTTQEQGQQPLTKDISEIDVCENVNDVVTLPSAIEGRVINIINTGVQTLQVFPASGDYMNLVLDTSTTVNTYASSIFVCYKTGYWWKQTQSGN